MGREDDDNDPSPCPRPTSSVGRAHSVPRGQNQRSLVEITGFPQNKHFATSSTVGRAPRVSADLMHWFMRRFPPLRQFTFVHGGGRGLLKPTIVIHSRQLPPSSGEVLAPVRSSTASPPVSPNHRVDIRPSRRVLLPRPALSPPRPSPIPFRLFSSMPPSLLLPGSSRRGPACSLLAAERGGWPWFRRGASNNETGRGPRCGESTEC